MEHEETEWEGRESNIMDKSICFCFLTQGKMALGYKDVFSLATPYEIIKTKGVGWMWATHQPREHVATIAKCKKDVQRSTLTKGKKIHPTPGTCWRSFLFSLLSRLLLLFFFSFFFKPNHFVSYSRESQQYSQHVRVGYRSSRSSIISEVPAWFLAKQVSLKRDICHMYHITIRVGKRQQGHRSHYYFEGDHKHAMFSRGLPGWGQK